VKFLVDAHLPPSLAAVLNDAVHARNLPRGKLLLPIVFLFFSKCATFHHVFKSPLLLANSGN